MPKSLVVLRHVAFEDLGTLEAPLRERGYEPRYVDVPTAEFPIRQAEEADLLVVLGGPLGVYEVDEYPFVAEELALLRKRLAAQKPTLGICLGAQLMAAALGAKVYGGDKGAEIGWFELTPGADAAPEWFAPLLAPGLKLFHWHGDTFDLPAGATHLAGSAKYPHQAFSIGNYALGLQFHPEVVGWALERWYVGHCAELHAKGLTAAGLRTDGESHAPALEAVADKFWQGWLDSIL